MGLDLKKNTKAFIIGAIISTVVYYVCLLTFKYIGMSVALETDSIEDNYTTAMILYAIFGGLGWYILAHCLFRVAIKHKKGLFIFGVLMFVVWMLFIGLVFMPPHNKWRKYNNYKDAIGTGVATLDCWKNGTSLKMPDPSTGINYVELAGDWYPKNVTDRKRTQHGYKYEAYEIVNQGPLQCQFDQPIYAVCIRKFAKPCFGTHYGFTMLRRAPVMPYTDGWLLNKIPQYNKLTHWEWDVNPRRYAIGYVALCEEEEKEFWIVASCIHFVLFLIALIVFLYFYCRGSSSKDSDEVSAGSIVSKEDCAPDGSESA
eukprot:TRINITY_DN1808_c0_g2_i8.p1 TRINITY_DN1808_c0_g2~~TRINITY_DN1808_c0_g2_i8.p1  ORF type:complete len:321 (+),score=46.01 TRINITY_DN1808_c0_g2_i8:22-963(+)